MKRIWKRQYHGDRDSFVITEEVARAALARSYDNVDTLMSECEEGQQIRTIWSYYWYEEAIQCYISKSME